MNILFDFITTQWFFGTGGCEYIRRVYYALIERIDSGLNDVNIIGVIDSSLPETQYEDLTTNALLKHCVSVVDINGKKLKDLVVDNHIDKIFVGVTQVWAERYSFTNVDCEVITITHDIHDEEVDSIRFYEYNALFGSAYMRLRQIGARAVKSIKSWLGITHAPLSGFINALKDNEKWRCITVSEYSRHSLEYFYEVPSSRIQVLYSPERTMECNDKPSDKKLAEIIASGRKYYLLISADRPLKNANRTLLAFNRYCEKNFHDKKERPLFVTVGMNKSEICEGHVDLARLTESDLVCAYKHCFALVFSSFFEGFGYPPMEAMKYGVPVLASNVTSIPEIVGDAAITFSPFYICDIYRAFCMLTDENRNQYSKRSLEWYKVINEKQNADLVRLVDIIVHVAP